MKEDPTLFIIDGDPATLAAARSVAQAKGIRAETYVGAAEFCAGDLAKRSGCILIAGDIPGLEGTDALVWLSKEGLSTPVIVAVSPGDTVSAMRAKEMGACVVLERPIDISKLRDGVMYALSVGDRASAQLRLARLTKLESLIYEMLCAGMSDHEIADEIDCRLIAVQFLRARVMERLDAESVADLLHLKVALKGA